MTREDFSTECMSQLETAETWLDRHASDVSEQAETIRREIREGAEYVNDGDERWGETCAVTASQAEALIEEWAADMEFEDEDD